MTNTYRLQYDVFAGDVFESLSFQTLEECQTKLEELKKQYDSETGLRVTIYQVLETFNWDENIWSKND